MDCVKLTATKLIHGKSQILHSVLIIIGRYTWQRRACALVHGSHFRTQILHSPIRFGP
jgi:hypothetical protein